MAAAAVAAAVGLPGVALAGEPPAAHDPALRLHCPDGRRIVETYAPTPSRETPRKHVRWSLPYAALYTQAHMRGLLDVRESTDGAVTTVVARGERREPIASWRFVRHLRGWALRGSAECADRDPEATRWELQADSRIRCPGYYTGGIWDYQVEPAPPPDPAFADPAAPEPIARDTLLRHGTGYAREHMARPGETTSRFEASQAEVLFRDATRSPIAIVTLDHTWAGWQVHLDAECSTLGPGD